MQSHQVDRLGADFGTFVFRELDQQLRRRKRSEELHHVERSSPIVRLILDVFGHADQLLIPFRSQLLLNGGDFLTAPRAIQLRLPNRGDGAFERTARRDLACPDDAVDAAVRAAAAGAEVEPAVRRRLQYP